MASVFYLVMFMLYTMMGSNNNLHCQAATSLDYKCGRALIELGTFIVDHRPSGPGNFVEGPIGTLASKREPRIRNRCNFVPSTLSGRDLVLCKCKAQDLFGRETPGGITGLERADEEYLLKVLNALDNDKELAKSCGINEDCDTAFRSVLSPCEVVAREAMNACAPMVKAAAKNDFGGRAIQSCCSEHKMVSCSCNQMSERKNEREFFRAVKDTLRDNCSLYNPSVCNLVQENCVIRYRNLLFCKTILRQSPMNASDLAVEATLPLIDPFYNGCCLDKESCKCDPRSVSCCRKLGELSKNKNKWESCMCQLLKSKTTPDSTLDFLNFVRSNRNLVQSCQNISPVYTATCFAPQAPFTTPPREVAVDSSKGTLTRAGYIPNRN